MKSLIWFKKDLRVHDHAPLNAALAKGEAVGLYVYEPEWLKSPEFDPSHLQFVNECIAELIADLKSLNVPLRLLMCSATEAFERMYREWSFDEIQCHEETGLMWTYQRDLQVLAWAKAKGIPVIEHRQFAVIRRLKNRDQWNKLRIQTIERPVLPQPSPQLKEPIRGDNQPLCFSDLRVQTSSNKTAVQKGGRAQALKTLDDFLYRRGEYYSSQMSSPLTSVDGCSRISPYLTYGAMSLCEVHARTQKRKQHLQFTEGQWRRSLFSFEKRLWWHCHFIQKLESEPEIEFQNQNRAFDGLREAEFNESYFQAWCRGETGYPFVDACMRSLHQTGWINFRMRAMLVSFASYHLWLHWRKPAQFLARHFLDFEPGIHFSQFQMQSGVTGINAIRVYSPYKQSLDQDPEGIFIRRYCPELAAVPSEWIHYPEQMPPLLAMAAGFKAGSSYPLPIVNHGEAYNLAKSRIFSWKKRPEVKAAAKLVLQKHGSRKNRHFPTQHRGLD